MNYRYSVPDMNCGHCQKRIETALKEGGLAASWKVNLSDKTVEVESSADSQTIATQIHDAGYSPTLL